jgi:hypothetical protein
MLQVLLGGGGLQWLLERDAAASLLVLEARQDLPPDVVLQLLEGVWAGAEGSVQRGLYCCTLPSRQ